MASVERSLRATYLIETPVSAQKAAETLAGEASSGTFVKVPGETDELKQRAGAKVESVRELETRDLPALPGARAPRGASPLRYTRAIVEISWPYENLGENLPVLVSTVAGGEYDLSVFSGIRLLDLEFPAQYARCYPGPQFGIAGTRRLTGVEARPIIGSIIKPCIGLSPEQTAERVGELAEGGVDFIKDDEVLGDAPVSPFRRRVKEVMAVVNRHADRFGKKVMYAFNVSGEIDDMLRRHDLVLEHGGTCIMANVLSIGLAGLGALRRHAQLPIHGHRCGFGALNRHELLGMEFTAYHKLWRLVGIDHIHTNGIRNKFYESDESVVRSIKACHAPLLGGPPVLPVLGAGQWAGQAVDTYRLIESTDVLYLCGGGILAHPDGIRAGVDSVRQAWEAAVAGRSLEQAAADHPELRRAVEFFGEGG